MHRLTFTGALLTGLGTIVLIHGGRPGVRGHESRANRSDDIVGEAQALAPPAGGVMLLAGVVLVAAGWRREATLT